MSEPLSEEELRNVEAQFDDEPMCEDDEGPIRRGAQDAAKRLVAEVRRLRASQDAAVREAKIEGAKEAWERAGKVYESWFRPLHLGGMEPSDFAATRSAHLKELGETK
jgi:hypothetical protein